MAAAGVPCGGYSRRISIIYIYIRTCIMLYVFGLRCHMISIMLVAGGEDVVLLILLISSSIELHTAIRPAVFGREPRNRVIIVEYIIFF